MSYLDNYNLNYNHSPINRGRTLSGQPSGNRQTYPQGTRNSINKLNNVRNKFHEVIDLVKGQNQAVTGELTDVYDAQKAILHLVSQQSLGQPQHQRKGSHSNQNQHGSSGLNHAHSNQNLTSLHYQPHQQNFQQSAIQTPINQSVIPQRPPQESHYYIPNFSQLEAQNNYPANISHSNIGDTSGIGLGIYPQSQSVRQTTNLQPYNYEQIAAGGGLGPGRQQYQQQQQQYQQSQLPQPQPAGSQPLKQSFNMLKNHPVQLSEDALRLIQQIEKKALSEIQALRAEKIQLLNKLKQEIRQGNELKRRNLSLQSALRASGGAQGHSGAGSADNSQQTANLRAHVNMLQQELQHMNGINQNLNHELSRLSSGGGGGSSNMAGIEQLLAQGQAIRQETLRLIRLKEESSGSYSRSQNHQRNHSSSPRQGGSSSLGEKTSSIVNPNNNDSYSRLSRKPYNANSNSYQGNSGGYGTSTGQYEDLVSEMKRITGF